MAANFNKNTTLLKDAYIPEVFVPPQWVYEEVDDIFLKIKNGVKNNDFDTKLNREIIKRDLFYNKFDIIFPLKKKNMSFLLENMYDAFDDETFKWKYWQLLWLGFKLSSLKPSSFTIASIMLPEKFKEAKNKIAQEFFKRRDEARKTKSEKKEQMAIIDVNKKFNKLTLDLIKFYTDNVDTYPVINLLNSGAKGSVDDFRKILLAVGISINSKNEINDVIPESHLDGLSMTQMHNYSSQAIVSQFKKSRETAKPGYLARKLNTVATNIKLSKLKDCGTERRLKLKIEEEEIISYIANRRYSLSKHGSLDIIKGDEDLVGKTIYLRSPLYCEAKDGICEFCYDSFIIKRMNLKPHSNLGILAGTSIAENLSDLTLKSAHTGLSLGIEEVDLQQDILNYSD